MTLERVFWGLLLIIAANIIFRHGGDIRDAQEEAKEWYQQAKESASPRARSAWEWMKSNKLIVLVAVLALIYVGNSLWQQAQPKTINVFIDYGKNIVEDRCGNPVEVWGIAYGEPRDPTRLEVTIPVLRYTEVRILGVGANPSQCEIIVPFDPTQGE